MSDTKVAVFDTDGVLALPEEFFSIVYARSHGLAHEPFASFFKEVFPAALIGQADLKELIAENQSTWQWDGNVDELLSLWFETENVINMPLLDLIQKARLEGTPCYIATNQEKYRGEYIREVMFKGMFDDYFVSADLGVMKPDLQFFKVILEKIEQANNGIKPSNVLFIDDSESHIEAAKQLGLNANLYQSVEDVAELLSR